MLDTRTGTCPPTWTYQSNTNVLNGQRNPASTVEDCQTACEIDVECTGFDYVPANIQEYRCWLSGPWSGTRNSGTPGITHYDINRNCSGMFLSSLLYKRLQHESPSPRKYFFQSKCCSALEQSASESYRCYYSHSVQETFRQLHMLWALNALPIHLIIRLKHTTRHC